MIMTKQEQREFIDLLCDSLFCANLLVNGDTLAIKSEGYTQLINSIRALLRDTNNANIIDFKEEGEK